jgi:hypothetical protein
MVIALDTGTNGGNTAGTSHTYAHTCTGSNLILFVSVATNSASDLISGVTYNSVAMTLVDKQQGTSTNYSYLFYLINPATGANNVVVSASSSCAIYSDAVSYTGAKQSAQPDSSGKGTSTGATLALSTTVVAANCWLVASGCDFDGVYDTGGLITLRGRSGASGIGDSDGVVATGSQSLTWTTTPTSNPTSGVIASFAPAVDGGGTLDLTSKSW